KMYLGHVKVLLGMFLSLKTLYRKRTVIWPFYFYTIIRTLSEIDENISFYKLVNKFSPEVAPEDTVDLLQIIKRRSKDGNFK
ncbi:hypothetical protein O3V87_14620, partial [Staphylococcus aureus]|nr:hypothetical protein [Staphylococcus aureus]